MFQNKIIDCTDLFIEIIRFVSEIKDLLSLILLNKQCHEIIENSNCYQILCKDRLENEIFNKLKQEEKIINWKEKFIELISFSWSECLQTTQPLQQLQENMSEHISVKCNAKECYLSSNQNISFITQQYYRHIRSKYPILKDITLYLHIRHLQKPVKHFDDNYLLFGIMNENTCNTIVENQFRYTYNGEILLEKVFTFNTSYASNGFISCTEGKSRKASLFGPVWNNDENVICIKVKGIKEGNIAISYYLNDKFVYEVTDVLKGIDVINCNGNRLYFVVDMRQTLNNVNNTVVIGSTTKELKGTNSSSFVPETKKKCNIQ